LVDALDKNFARLCSQLIVNCEKKSIIMVPFEKLRTPKIQANYWVQGRSQEQIDEKVNELKEAQALFLAECLAQAKIKDGPIISNALPGCSWHQFGEAVDCYWLRDGYPCWDLEAKDTNNQNGYEIYANEAKILGLEAGFYWRTFRDSVHVQLQSYSSPLELYSIVEIDAVMKDFYD